MEVCCECECPVDSSANDIRSCRKCRVELGVCSDGTHNVQCCRCANLRCREACLFCIDQMHKEATDGEKLKASNKRKRSGGLATRAEQFDNECEEQEAVESKIQAIRKTIADLETEEPKTESGRRTLDAGIADARRELEAAEKIPEHRGEKIETLESNKKRRQIEESEANRTLEEARLCAPSAAAAQLERVSNCLFCSPSLTRSCLLDAVSVLPSMPVLSTRMNASLCCSRSWPT